MAKTKKSKSKSNKKLFSGLQGLQFKTLMMIAFVTAFAGIGLTYVNYSSAYGGGNPYVDECPNPPTLRVGSASYNCVKRLQWSLRQADYKQYGLTNSTPASACWHGAVDGSFGPITRDGVIALQRREGISVDGVVGPQTWSMINSRYSQNTREDC